MKVLEKKTWSLEVTCFYCHSLLEIDATDIRSQTEHSSAKDFYITCLECKEINKLSPAQLNTIPPKILEAATEAFVNVYRKTPQIGYSKNISAEEKDALLLAHIKKKLSGTYGVVSL